jgi:hypothetical protein
LLIISMSFQVEGAYQPSDNLLMVIITYEDGDHDLGSEVPFKVHVLEDCEYVDADNVTVTSGYTHSWYDIDTRREIGHQRHGTHRLHLRPCREGSHQRLPGTRYKPRQTVHPGGLCHLRGWRAIRLTWWQ